MPAGLTRSETKRDVHETTTCCACSEYLDYGLPEGESDDIQNRNHEVVFVILGVSRYYRSQISNTTCAMRRDLL